MRQIKAAVRAYTPDPDRRPARQTRWHRPQHVLVLDTETWTDPAQALRFGFFRYARVNWSKPAEPVVTVLEESIIVADDPDPHDLEVLWKYRRRKPDVNRVSLDAQYAIQLYARRDFVEDILYPAMTSKTTWIVGANLPFDLSRLVAPHLEISRTGWEAGPGYAVDRASGRRTRRDNPGFYTHGFSLPFVEYEDEEGWHERRVKDNPRLGLKRLGPQRTGMGLIDPRFHGHFLDVLTLGAALSGQHLPLTAEKPKKGFCEVFGVDYEAWLRRFGVPFSKRKAPHGEALTPEYVSYNRADVAATTELFVALMEEHRALGIQTQPTRIFSSASISKDTLRRLRVPLRLESQPDFPEEVMGFAMTSFYGGRSECRIRRTPVPVTYVDVKSMYPTVSALLGLQDLMAADRVEVRDSEAVPSLLDETQRFLDDLTLDAALQRPTWARLNGIGLVEPRGDLLPVRADWRSEALGIAQCYVDAASEPSWWALPDLAAARLRDPGSANGPRLQRVILFEANGTADLKGINIAGRRLDLRKHDLYVTLIETREKKGKEDERWDRFLKVVANSLYGITAEMNAERTVDGKKRPIDVHALRTVSVPTSLPESPGKFFFAPVATLTTAGARLILALIERLVTDRGGTWCFADTDSMAIVSSSSGGLILCPGGDRRIGQEEAVLALSWADVDEIREALNSLNPYRRKIVEHLLKVEDVNHEGADPDRPRRDIWAWAISAKRYMLFQPRGGAASIATTGELRTTDGSDEEEIAEHRLHGLGHLMDPSDPESDDRSWTKQAWRWMFETDRGTVGLADPAWFSSPALSRHTVSSPQLLRAFSGFNEGLRYADSIKPFNFMLVAHITREEAERRTAPFRLGAPYSKDRRDWLEPIWRNVRASSSDANDRLAITTGEFDLDVKGVAQVESYASVIRDYLDHPESKADDDGGAPCQENSRGQLHPPTVTVESWLAIGKETNRLGERTVGLAGTWESTNVYPEGEPEAAWKQLLEALSQLGVERVWREIQYLPSSSEVRHVARISRKTVSEILAGRSRGTPVHRSILAEAGSRGMRRWLRVGGVLPERGGLDSLTRQFLGAWDELVDGPSKRYGELVTHGLRLPRGGVSEVADCAGVSRQKVRHLRDPEARAAVVLCVEKLFPDS